MTETPVINTIIPAEPGWKLAVFVAGNNEHDPCFWFEDVIAWRIEIKSRNDCENHYVTPITVDGTNVTNLNSQWALRRPDGEYIEVGDGEIGSEAEALARLQKWVEIERAKKQKTA